MKRPFSYLAAAAVLILTAAAPAFSFGNPVPEPGTMATLGAVAVGGLIARKILKRK
jgi:hypothetical protein